LIAVGIYFFFRGNLFNGVWFAFIGWFIQSAAYMSYRRLIFEISIKGIKVKDVLKKDIIKVARNISLEELVNDYFMKYSFSRFPVVSDKKAGKIIGVISIHDIKAFPRDEWDTINVGQVVKSLSEDEKIDLNTSMSDAFRQMSSNNLGHLLVMDGNKIKGMITKTDVMNYIKFYTDLH